MCGIMGFVGKPKSKKAANFSYQLATKLLSETVTRGSHATGVYSLLPPKDGGEKNRVFIYKLDAPSTQFVKTSNWKKMRADGEPFLLLGHCRFYTHGSPQDHVNNHPHVSEDKKLALIHNGVISGYTGLKKSYQVQGECDSEVILRVIETEDTVVEGIKKAFRVICTGSMACMVSYYDSETKIGHFYAFRNDGNPIVVVDLREHLGQLFLGSTETILETAMKNCGLPKKIQKEQVVEIPSYEIWHCTTENLEWDVTEVEKPASSYSVTNYTGTNYYGSRSHRRGNVSVNTNRQIATSGNQNTQETEKLKTIRALLDTIIGSVTEIDEELTAGSNLGVSEDDLEEDLKGVAWDLEKIVNPALKENQGEEQTVADSEYFD